MNLRSIPVALIALAIFIPQTSFAQKMIPEQSTIIFLGDSITQAGVRPDGYVSIIQRELEKNHKPLGTKIIGAGISGNKVPDLQKRLQKDVLSKNPTHVVIYIGINDVWHSQSGRGTPKDKFETGLNDLVDQIQKVGAKVILCTPSVIGEKTDHSNPLDGMLDEYAQISRSVAADRKCQLIDLRKQFQSELAATNHLNRGKNILTRDGVHLNQAGNDFVAEQMLAGLGINYASTANKNLMRHVVLFKFKDDVSPSDVTTIVDAFGNLPNQIDQIIGYEAGTNVSPEQLDQGFTHAFVVTFRDAQGRDEYLPHPAHKAFVKLIGGKIDKVLVFDFTTH